MLYIYYIYIYTMYIYIIIVLLSLNHQNSYYIIQSLSVFLSIFVCNNFCIIIFTLYYIYTSIRMYV